jgi:hypothetical protein
MHLQIISAGRDDGRESVARSRRLSGVVDWRCVLQSVVSMGNRSRCAEPARNTGVQLVARDLLEW